MTCWYCHWGWPKPIADIYDRHIEVAGHSAMHFGPAHCVWEDENFEREHLDWALKHFDEHRGDYTEAELTAVRQSLTEMQALPDSILDCAGTAGYDWSDDASNHPPPADLPMVRR